MTKQANLTTSPQSTGIAEKLALSSTRTSQLSGWEFPALDLPAGPTNRKAKRKRCKMRRRARLAADRVTMIDGVGVPTAPQVLTYTDGPGYDAVQRPICFNHLVHHTDGQVSAGYYAVHSEYTTDELKAAAEQGADLARERHEALLDALFCPHRLPKDWGCLDCELEAFRARAQEAGR